MITGTLKSKVDAIRQDFYDANKAQSSDVVNQLTMLMFIKMLDDKQNALEANAAKIGIKPKEDTLTFKDGEYQNYEEFNGEKVLRFTIPYEDLRWKNFKSLNSHDLARRIRDNVVPFIMDKNNDAVGKFAEYSQEYSYGFNSKENLLTKVVDKLSEVDPVTGKDIFNFVDTDLMGDVYEYICGSGISGQYRTPRHIIDMAVEMMKPKIGEKIIDPAMGTAGFIVEAAKYVQDNQKTELLNVRNKEIFNNEMFYGCDNDTNMARIGYMNCLLHNIKNPTVSVDSLLEYEYAKDYLGKFDLVLQNPPFSGSLDDSSLNGQILSVCKTSKTEFLFVALMLKLMKVGGRGMSIVPDGVLFNEQSQSHVNLRKELVDKQKLIGIISMPFGLFQAPTKKGSSSKGAGVKTSFLIFERTDNGSTDYVWFYNMKNDGFTLDAKHDPIPGSNIPDIIKQFDNLNKNLESYKKMKDEDKEEQRKNQWFFVPREEIVKNNYDLTLKKYAIADSVEIKHREISEIFNDMKKAQQLSNEYFKKIAEIFEVEN